MPLSGGAHVGPYQILTPLGAGGMGEVYRATDPRLKRQVAIKILPPALAADPGRLARFQREAEVLASLNHPHIAAIYGLEDANGTKALVMELVEGPTLADRIAQGPIPIDEALPIARQIAEALEAAHEQGIIHRDLKPANIKVRDDGAVKVLDFGLAKAREQASESSGADLTVDAANSPTVVSPVVSQVGVILGTAAYMSPEQARGRAVDKRTDVWAFGAVLYEMLTGTRAFEGDDVTELIASVMKSTPNWSALPPDVPPHIVTLIQRCLDKERRTRIGDIAVARFLLSGDAALPASAAAAGPAATAAPGSRAAGAGGAATMARTRWRQMLPWIAAAIVAGAAIGWVLPRRATTTDAAAVMRLQMGVQPAERIAPSAHSDVRPARTAMALPPDGRRVVFAGAQGGVTRLYVRDLDRAEAEPIPGTEGGSAPFFSPDGAWIGFASATAILKVPAAGGPAVAVCDIPVSVFWGASWTDDNTIVFATRGGLFKVSAAGGTPSALTKADAAKGERHLLPHVLPGGKALLFTAPPDVVLLALDGSERRTLLEGAADARYIDTGHLVYMKAGTLMAVPFDVRARQVTGPPVALIEGVMQGLNAGNSNDETHAGQFAISRAGTLLYALGGIVPSRLLTLTWVDRRGAAEPLAGAASRPYLTPRVSPDGRRIALEIRRDGSRETDVWVYDIARGSPTRLTFDGGSSPVWSPDGRRLVYRFGTGGIGNLYVMNADGSGKPERLTTSAASQVPTSWTSGANVITFMQRPTPETFGIWTLPMGGTGTGAAASAAPARAALFLESRFNLTFPVLSPNGRAMAYVSNESGALELYVQTYPDAGEKTRISTAGGHEPMWTADGKELLFRAFTPAGGRLFLSAAIRSWSPFQADAPRVLFEAKPGDYDSTVPTRSWDVRPDGQRFLLLRVADSTDTPVTALHVVLNWADELTRRAPAK